METLRSILLAILSVFVGILCILVTSFGISLALRLEPIIGMEFTTLGYSVGAIWMVTGLLFLGLSTATSLIFVNSFENPTKQDLSFYLICIGSLVIALLLYLPITDDFLNISGCITTIVALIGGILMILDKIRNKKRILKQ